MSENKKYVVRLTEEEREQPSPITSCPTMLGSGASCLSCRATIPWIDPMVLMLGRGVWCPKDRQQLHELVRFSAQCVVGSTRIVTITTDDLSLSNDLRLGVGADWPFLHHEKRVIQKDLEIQEYTDPYNNPMIPHTFVLEPGLRIYKIYNGYWYWGRPSTAELHKDLREITRKIRPDYKIDTPEMRAKWEQRDADRLMKSVTPVCTDDGGRNAPRLSLQGVQVGEQYLLQGSRPARSPGGAYSSSLRALSHSVPLRLKSRGCGGGAWKVSNSLGRFTSRSLSVPGWYSTS
jgi:hypothetical protein